MNQLRGDNADDLQGGDPAPRTPRRLPHRVYVAGIGCVMGVIVGWTLATCILLNTVEHRPWWACAVLAFMLVAGEIWLATVIVGRDKP